ncbi:MAG TPA: hypothetical protein VF750_09060, partial [Sphingomicrobium sp.]
RRQSGNAQRLFDHAQNVFYIGEVARFSGRPTDAEKAWREYKRLAEQMVALQPDNLKYRMEALYASQDIGISLYFEHRFREAQQLFEATGSQMEKLASFYPSNTSYQKEFASVLAWAADARRSRGNLKGAVAAREKQIALLQQVLGAGADSNIRSGLITAREGLAIALAESGNTDGAIQRLQEAVGDSEELILIEPRNAMWKQMAADTRLALGQILLSTQRRGEAEQQVSRGCALTGGLPPAYATAKARLSTNCALMRSRLALAAGAPSQAVSFAQQALAFARKERSEDPVADIFRSASVNLLLGDARLAAGDRTGAQAAWNEAIGRLPSDVEERPIETNQRMQLLRRMIRVAEAEPLQARLNGIGYRSMT